MQNLDTLIAFATVMLGASLLITVWTQMISSFLGLRGASLRWGLKTLFANSDGALKRHAPAMAQEILEHPLISDSTLLDLFKKLNLTTRRLRLANGIEKEELRNILRKLATPPNPEELRNQWTWQEELHVALHQPAGTEGHILTNLEDWFDAVMLRVSERFAMQARLWSVAGAVVIVSASHLDALALFEKLSTNTALRNSLVAQSATLDKLGAELLTVSTNAVSTNAIAPVPDPEPKLKAELEQFDQQRAKLAGLLDQFGPQLLPDSNKHGWACLCSKSKDFSVRHLLGMLMTVALLSLGAPFWFQALKSLSSLRPVLAKQMAVTAEAAAREKTAEKESGQKA